MVDRYIYIHIQITCIHPMGRLLGYAHVTELSKHIVFKIKPLPLVLRLLLSKLILLCTIAVRFIAVAVDDVTTE